MIVQTGGYVLLLAVWSIVAIKALKARNKAKEALVYGLLMAFCAFIGSLLIMGIRPPSLHAPVEWILKPIGEAVLKR